MLVGEHRETHAIKGETYRLLLRKRAYECGVIVNDNALDTAVETLLTWCSLIRLAMRLAAVRTAQHGDSLYHDLCNDQWEAVEATKKAWQIITNSRVKFVRRNGMLALPRPVAGGKIDQLRQFIRATDDDWPLLVSWLMAALRPVGPYPILLVTGEKGSCKSTACRLIRGLIDPNSVPIRDAPLDGQTLMIWAANSHVVAVDNMSKMLEWLSNAMCRLATGGGHSQRCCTQTTTRSCSSRCVRKS